MCLLLFSYKSIPDYKLIIAANRDEFYGRPTSLLHNWENQPGLFAGKDLMEQEHGLVLPKPGELQGLLITGICQNINNNAPTRGKLVTDFLLSKIPAEKYSSLCTGECRYLQRL